MTPIMKYLMDDVLPSESGEAEKLRRQANFYTVCNRELFRRGFSSPLLKCLDED